VLYRSSDASSAPDVFAPDVFAPDVFAPDVFAPDAFAPDAFAPDAFAPDAAGCASIETAGELAVFPDHDPIGTGPFTLETWLRTSVPGVTVVAANRTGTGPGTYRGYLFGVFGSGFPLIQLSDTPNIEATTRVDDGAWHHVAFARLADGTLSAFVDGADVALTFPSSPRDLPIGTSVVLGRDSASGGSDFPGRLRMLRVWRVARTVEEVRASWSSSVGAHPDLLFEAPLDGVAVGGTVTAQVRRGGVLSAEVAATTRLAVPDCP
jgi:hypothetical protein